MKRIFQSLLLAAVTLAACFTFTPALAEDVGGINLESTVTVAGKSLKLNGAGIRIRVIVKVYALGLYLPEKKDTTAGVLDSVGPRRFAIGMLREINSEELGQAFMAGITANTDKAERSKMVAQLGQFGDMFANQAPLKKGDMLVVDWIPGKGTDVHLNGKSLGEPLPDLAFYNALLKIWLGDKPVDTSLKPLLLGGKGG